MSDKPERNEDSIEDEGLAALSALVRPSTMPPPGHSGDLVEPARARPVPFCRHGLLLPPWTSPLVLAECVP